MNKIQDHKKMAYHVGFEIPPDWMLGLHATKRLAMDRTDEFCTSVEVITEDLQECVAKYGDYIVVDDNMEVRVLTEKQYKEVYGNR